ncbi:MAG: hypothetical protein J6M60_06325 [Clostridia bacterium]|nr:hypothetical protein [Clostridia bacterium]
MEKMYKRSLQMMKELEEMPTKVEWNKIAKEKCLMSYVSISCRKRKSFPTVWKELKED